MYTNVKNLIVNPDKGGIPANDKSAKNKERPRTGNFIIFFRSVIYFTFDCSKKKKIKNMLQRRIK